MQRNNINTSVVTLAVYLLLKSVLQKSAVSDVQKKSDMEVKMKQLCRTWFSSTVTAQGLRRVKEYARLGFIIYDTAAGNGPYDGVLTPMASCRMGKP